MAKVTFNNKNNSFFTALKAEVEQYFNQHKIKKTGNWKLYIKTGVLIPSAICLYILLLLLPMPGVLSIFLCAVLGFVLASIGFNVMHDACHGSSMPLLVAYDIAICDPVPSIHVINEAIVIVVTPTQSFSIIHPFVITQVRMREIYAAINHGDDGRG